jgi:hypothetical protein
MNAADMKDLTPEAALKCLAQMPAWLCEAIDAASDAELARRAPGSEFSLGEHACHLRDVEREGYLVRARRLLAEESPTLQGFDGAAAALERDYASQDGRRAAHEFAAARAELLGLVAPLDGVALAREGLFAGRRITLADMVCMAAGHDAGHRTEVELLCEAMGMRPWK